MNLPILHYLDVLIGFSVVMLLATTLVTSVTQAIVRLLNLRAANLQLGLEALVSELDPNLKAHAKSIAGEVLGHRLVAEAGSIFPRKGAVVQREELIRILFELAAPGSTLASNAPARTALAAAIGRDPVATLQAIRQRAQELERDAPWVASHVRQTQAILENAAGEFVGKITDWFDETMDRLSQRFALKTQILSVVAAVLVAAGLGLDSIDLLKRLDRDEVMRNQALALGEKVEGAREKLKADRTPEERKVAQGELDTLLNQSTETPGSALLPEAAPLLYFQEGLRVRWPAFPGVLLSIILLSLGAPFWFDMLKNSLRLRPLLSGKEEQERNERRVEQAAPLAPAPAAGP